MYGELASVRGVVDLSPQEALGEAETFLIGQGYEIVQRTETSITAQRRAPASGEAILLNLTVAAIPQPQGGVVVKVRGNDQEGVQERQAAWMQWSESLPKRAEPPQQQADERRDAVSADAPLPPPPQAGTPDLRPPPQAPPTQAPPPPPPGGGRSPLRWVALGAGGCLVLVVLLVGLIGGLAILGSGGGGTADSPGSPEGGSDNGSGELFTKDNYGELVADPDAHRGARVEIGGQVFQKLEESGGELTFQMFADPENAEWSTVVVTEEVGDLDLNSDDYVLVNGEVLGTVEGENYFGTDLTAPEVQASEVRIVGAGQAIDPAQEVLTVNQTQSNQGFFITLRKIEFGEESTRAYVTIRNDTGRGASFYTFDAKIQQGSTQVDYLDDFAYYEEEPQSDLRPGVQTEGVLAFGPVAPNQPFELVIPWTSNNYRVNTRPVVFQISP
jgi:hypothetical protein